MNFRSYAEIASDIPLDDVEEDGEIVIFAGKAAAEAIAEALRQAGYDVEAPEHMHEHGWDLNVYVEGKRIWLEVQGFEEPGGYILQTEAMTSFFRRLFGVDLGYYAEFLRKLNDGLRADPRFGSIKWYELRDHLPVGEPADDPLRVMDYRG